MMGPEEITERRKTNHTPTIALGIAAFLLLVVGALSYKDFVRTKLEKEYSAKEAEMMERFGYFGNLSSGAQGQPQMQQPRPQVQPQPQMASPAAPPQPTFAQQAPDPALVQSAQDLRVESNLPRPRDPEMDRIEDSLAQARFQSQQTEQRYRDLTGDVENRVREETGQATAAITEELPDFLREAVENPPGGNPVVEERLDRMREQVRLAPALGQVTSYDSDWGILTFNAGAQQLVKADQRFAVRRGTDILGWVKVDQVEENQSIATLVTKNKNSDTAAKPEVGDDLIDFELF